MSALVPKPFALPVNGRQVNVRFEREAGRFVGPLRRRSPTRPQRRLTLWLPLTPFAMLLAPFAMAASMCVRMKRGRRRLSAAAAASAVLQLIFALSGTEISVETPRVRLRLHIL